MYEPTDRSAQIQRRSLVVLAVGTTVLFLWIIWDFLLALLMAAILSGMFHPIYRRIARRIGYRRGWAAMITVGGVLLVLIVPIVIFLIMVADQVIQLSKIARPWVETNAGRFGQIDRLFDRLPQLRMLRPYRDQIMPKLGELASELGSLSVQFVTEAARQAATFTLMLFVVLYAMYFFLKDGKVVLDKMLYYVPLPPEYETRMLDRFMSVSRATIKGTIIIGSIQGALGGIAFAVAGISGAAVWGTVMAVLSAIPGLGHALVWVPVTVYLAATSQWSAAIGLFAWCAGVVGSVDNFLRPWLIGKDTELPDIVILVSTLGGLVLFGPLGFIVGPIVAALFVTVWELYGTAFEDLLPPAPPAPASVAEFGSNYPPPPVQRRGPPGRDPE
ncbi:MAG: AI-2E family transporter [Deltaproteobacteria bacterium]